MSVTQIKIDGITSVEDAVHAVESGVNAIGFIFADSPRQVTLEQAIRIAEEVPPFVAKVGVFVDDSLLNVKMALGSCVDYVQLHGTESPDFVKKLAGMQARGRILKAIHIRGKNNLDQISNYEEASAFVLDAYVDGKWGGTGKTFDWKLAKAAVGTGRRIILAGGLTPDNVKEALETASPFGVDVASGVEKSPGVKDPERMRRFVEAVREYDASKS